MDTEESLTDAVGDATTVLQLASRRESGADAVCTQLLSRVPPSELGLLYVTLLQSPVDRMDVWDRHGHGTPADAVIVAVGTAAERGDDDPEGARVKRVSDPTNLTKFGVTMTESLDELSGVQPAVCFHSLSALLQYVSVEQAFQFVSVLGNHFDAAGAHGHFHMDPAAHDAQTRATLEQVFDAIVEVEDGEYTVVG